MAGAQGERWLARVGGDEVHTATRCCRIRLQPLACRSQQSTDRTGSRVSPLVYGSPCSRVCRLDPKSQRRTCRARWLLTSLRNRLRPRPSLSTPYAHERNRRSLCSGPPRRRLRQRRGSGGQPGRGRELVPPGRRTRRYRRPNQAREPLPHGCPRDRQGLGRGTPLADTIASTLSPREREADIRIDREAVAREMKPEDATRAEAHAREWLERVARHPLPRLEARAG
jgi:hypothetical protein